MNREKAIALLQEWIDDPAVEVKMKVFEVTTECCPGDSKEVITERQFVTSEDNNIKSVMDYFAKHCSEYEKDLVGVREVLTVTQNLIND